LQEDLGQPCDVLKFGVEAAWFFAQLYVVAKMATIHKKIYVNFVVLKFGIFF
jgi:hypothetical protein